jgi:hypothetical protein
VQRNGDWQRASKLALEAYETALRAGADKEIAVDVAVARARSVMPVMAECQVREALAIVLAERRLACLQEEDLPIGWGSLDRAS